MPNLSKKLDRQLRQAIAHFWRARGDQSARQGLESDADRGDRRAVTGGKHLDGFLELLATLLQEAGLERSHIYWHKNTELPGWYRAEKNWDLLVVADSRLIAVIEFKSQVGSFGNNFNNRSEEAMGSATDLWAAYENGAFQPSERPWLGYFMLLEDSTKVLKSVKVRQPHFKVFPQFTTASYLERYSQLLMRMLRTRLYDSACLLLSPRDRGLSGEYREPNPELNFTKFIASLFAKAASVAQTQPPGPTAPPAIEQPST